MAHITEMPRLSGTILAVEKTGEEVEGLGRDDRHSHAFDNSRRSLVGLSSRSFHVACGLWKGSGWLVVWTMRRWKIYGKGELGEGKGTATTLRLMANWVVGKAGMAKTWCCWGYWCDDTGLLEVNPESQTQTGLMESRLLIYYSMVSMAVLHLIVYCPKIFVSYHWPPCKKPLTASDRYGHPSTSGLQC